MLDAAAGRFLLFSHPQALERGFTHTVPHVSGSSWQMTDLMAVPCHFHVFSLHRKEEGVGGREGGREDFRLLCEALPASQGWVLQRAYFWLF